MTLYECQICHKKTTRWRRCDEHHRCDDCGTTEGLCFHTDGLVCGSCHADRAAAKQAAFNGDTSYLSEVVCPWCGYTHSDGWEMGEGERDCMYCEKPFELTRHVICEYSTSKITKGSE